MRNQQGFTLVELMIVVAIIAVIAAIAIPSILGARISANEQSAQATLRAYHGAQETTSQNAQIENSQVYWSCDIWGLYEYTPNPGSNGEPIEAIQRSVAQADNDDQSSYSLSTGSVPTTGPDRISDSGYFYAAFDNIGGSGSVDLDSSCTNPTSFAAQALPEHYDTTGRRMFAVGRRGDIYSIDGLQFANEAGSPPVDYSSNEILQDGDHLADFDNVDPDGTPEWTAE